ncbi:MAG: MerR family transcriptional regulator, partial [Actinomycetota bacterium]
MVEPNDELLRIGQVVELSGTPATTIRYYEQLGLLVAATRVGGQRRFHASVIATLMVIRFCRVAGLSLEDVAIVLDDRSPGRASTRDVAARQIERIDAQMAELALARSMMVAAAS